MALPDLLQWASVNRKSGLFRLHRNQLMRGIAFKEGGIVACATTDPSLIAHYLLGSGRVRPEALRDAKEQSRETQVPLEQVVIATGLVTDSELASVLADKSEETIYGLFDWVDAEFSFEECDPEGPLWTEVDTAVDEILLNGLQRLDEMKMVRKIFTSSGIVLELTGNATPKEIANSGMARRIVASIDGRRTLSEVLLNADASEFLVLKLLYHLFHKDVVRIARIEDLDSDSATLLDAPEEQASPVRAAGVAAPIESTDPVLGIQKAPVPESALDHETLMSLAQVAKQLEAGIEDGINEPRNASAPMAVEPTQFVFELEWTPVPLHTPERLAEIELDSDEEYLVSVIDGSESLQGILTLAPLDKDRLMIAIRGLIDKKLINI